MKNFLGASPWTSIYACFIRTLFQPPQDQFLSDGHDICLLSDLLQYWTNLEGQCKKEMKSTISDKKRKIDQNFFRLAQQWYLLAYILASWENGPPLNKFLIPEGNNPLNKFRVPVHFNGRIASPQATIKGTKMYWDGVSQINALLNHIFSFIYKLIWWYAVISVKQKYLA